MTELQLEMYELWNEPMESDHVDKSVLTMVEEYRVTANQEKDPQVQHRLIDEEYREWYKASREESWEEYLKEMADLVYVIYGAANSLGLDLDEAVRRVHENNMGRMKQDDGSIQYRYDGKVIKNPNYPKVNLKDLVVG